MSTTPAPLYQNYYNPAYTGSTVGFDNTTDPVKAAKNQRAVVQSTGDQFINQDQQLANEYAAQQGGTQGYLNPLEQNLASGQGGYAPGEASQIELSGQDKQNIVTGAGISSGVNTAASVGAAERAANAAGGNPAALATYRARAAQTQGANAGNAETQAAIQAQQAGSQGAQAVGNAQLAEENQGLGYLGNLQAQQGSQAETEQGLGQGAYGTETTGTGQATDQQLKAAQLPTTTDKIIGTAAGVAAAAGLADGTAEYYGGGQDAVLGEDGPEAIVKAASDPIRSNTTFMADGGAHTTGGRDQDSGYGFPLWLQNYLANVGKAPQYGASTDAAARKPQIQYAPASGQLTNAAADALKAIMPQVNINVPTASRYPVSSSSTSPLPPFRTRKVASSAGSSMVQPQAHPSSSSHLPYYETDAGPGDLVTMDDGQIMRLGSPLRGEDAQGASAVDEDVNSVIDFPQEEEPMMADGSPAHMMDAGGTVPMSSPSPGTTPAAGGMLPPWLQNYLANAGKNSSPSTSSPAPGTPGWNKTTPYQQLGTAIGTAIKPFAQKGLNGGSGASSASSGGGGSWPPSLGSPAGGVVPFSSSAQNAASALPGGLINRTGSAIDGVPSLGGNAVDAAGTGVDAIGSGADDLGEGAADVIGGGAGDLAGIFAADGHMPYLDEGEMSHSYSRGSSMMAEGRMGGGFHWSERQPKTLHTPHQIPLGYRARPMMADGGAPVMSTSAVRPAISNGDPAVEAKSAKIITSPTRVHLEKDDMVVPLSFRPKAKVRPSAALPALNAMRQGAGRAA